MQNFNYLEHIPLALLLDNCEAICLEQTCCDRQRLLPSQEYLKKISTHQKVKQLTSKSFLPHNHKENIISISDIIAKKYDNIPIFQSSLKKLSDITSTLVIVENSFSNSKQGSSFLHNKEFQNYCLDQAKKIATFYQQFNPNYFHDNLRKILVSYRENQICYKQLNVQVTHLIDEYNILEKSFYSPILFILNKGVQVRDLTSANSNPFEIVKKFSHSIISLMMEQLKKMIVNHSNRLENLSYFSLLTFQYLQVVTRIIKKYFLNLIAPREKENLIDQLIKYAKYFINMCDIQNALFCYNESLEFNPQCTDIYLQIAKLFKKQRDQNSMKIAFTLGLLQFPQKTMFLVGLLQSVNISEIDQENTVKEYQNMIAQNQRQGEFLILSNVFMKLKDSKTSSLFKVYHQSNDPLEIFNTLRKYILVKNQDSKNLNPLEKIQEAVEKRQKEISSLPTCKMSIEDVSFEEIKQSPVKQVQHSLKNINSKFFEVKASDENKIIKECPKMIEIKQNQLKNIEIQGLKRKIIKKDLVPLDQSTKIIKNIVIEVSDKEKELEEKEEEKSFLINSNFSYKPLLCGNIISRNISKNSEVPLKTKNLKIIKNQTNLGTLQNNFASSPHVFNSENVKILSKKIVKEVSAQEQIKDSSTNYTSTSNVNLSQSHNNLNYIEILSSDEENSVCFLDPVEMSISKSQN